MMGPDFQKRSIVQKKMQSIIKGNGGPTRNNNHKKTLPKSLNPYKKSKLNLAYENSMQYNYAKGETHGSNSPHKLDNSLNYSVVHDKSYNLGQKETLLPKIANPDKGELSRNIVNANNISMNAPLMDYYTEKLERPDYMTRKSKGSGISYMMGNRMKNGAKSMIRNNYNNSILKKDGSSLNINGPLNERFNEI